MCDSHRFPNRFSDSRSHRAPCPGLSGTLREVRNQQRERFVQSSDLKGGARGSVIREGVFAPNFTMMSGIVVKTNMMSAPEAEKP